MNWKLLASLATAGMFGLMAVPGAAADNINGAIACSDDLVGTDLTFANYNTCMKGQDGTTCAESNYLTLVTPAAHVVNCVLLG